MEREKLFHETVGILVDAYNNNKLEHGNCKACAVGNLITARGGVIEQANGAAWIQYINKSSFKLGEGAEKLALEHLSLTGYSVDEVIAIEAAFEAHRHEDFDYDEDLPRRDIYNNWKDGKLGLRNVYDMLCVIHQVDLEVEQLAKAEEVFV